MYHHIMSVISKFNNSCKVQVPGRVADIPLFVIVEAALQARARVMGGVDIAAFGLCVTPTIYIAEELCRIARGQKQDLFLKDDKNPSVW